ncbi:hypothetical protein [Streptacidiphilus melanogenes]|uniref:hypothetical protein n=1 Tax=Streptacidiphilus melanogenes TaxID=411235 RepID=UPI0006938C1A|nr:hypothetical protein [Streptacidiphilus melanogenes]
MRQQIGLLVAAPDRPLAGDNGGAVISQGRGTGQSGEDETMAERRGSRAVAAREKARARTAGAREREQRLEDLATTWFEVDDQIGGLREAAQARIDQYTARIRGELVQQVGQLEQRLTDAAAEMLELANASDVADRLGIPVAKVREIKATRKASGTPGDAAAASAPSPTSQAGSVTP